MKKANKYLSLFFFALGVILFVMLVHEVGLDHIVENISTMGFGIVYVFLFPIAWYGVQSFAWWRVLTDDGVKVSLWHVFFVKVTGEAVNTVTPISFIGGDPYRIYLLQKQIGANESTASVVIDRTMYILSVFLVLLTTLIVAWFTLPLPGAWQVLFPIFVIGFFMLFVVLVFFQKRGMLLGLFNLISKLGLKTAKIESLRSRLLEIDTLIGRFYSKHKLHFFEIMLLHYAGRMMGSVEIYLIVTLLKLDVTFVQCLLMMSLTILINLAFFFVPGSMGVMESGYGALFHLLHLNPVYGVTIQIVRRIRTLFWTAIGVVAIPFYKSK